MTSTERQAFIEEVRDNLEGAKKHDACDDWLIENRHKMAQLIVDLSKDPLLDEDDDEYIDISSEGVRTFVHADGSRTPVPEDYDNEDILKATRIV